MRKGSKGGKGRPLPPGTTEHLGVPIAVWYTLSKKEKSDLRTKFNSARNRRRRDVRGAKKRGISVEEYAAMSQSERIKWTRRKNGTQAGSHEVQYPGQVCAASSAFMNKWIRQSIQHLQEAGGMSADERQRWTEYRKGIAEGKQEQGSK